MSLERFGIRWNGSHEPMATPMDDGYWTPWHIAEAEIAALRERCGRLERIASGCHEAGLLDEHGNLRKPHCWWTADGEAIPCPTEDLDCNGSPGDVCKVRPAWGGKWEWWALDSDEDAIGPFDNSEAAERAAKGGTDGH